ncbi:MAG: aspartate aminotransferase family protein [Verrucomicrobiota bacterium]
MTETAQNGLAGAAKIATTYGPRPLTLVKGAGARVWDDAGNAYLDFSGGVAVNSLGHCHPAIQQVLSEQAAQLMHVSNLFYNQPQCLLAEKLVELTGPGSVFFCNSGTEANEGLIKLARKAGVADGKFEIITATNSFHGRTYGGISATGQDKVKAGFEPLVPGFTHVPFNDLAAVEAAITDKTTAVLIEGIQGEGGIIPASPEYLLGLRKLTQEKGCLLLWDGVQCGAFRCGDFQSYTTLLKDVDGGDDFLPDAIAMAKSLGAGFPIGAVWISESYAGVLTPGSHGSTFGGNPMACAVALAVIREVESQNLCENIAAQGNYLVEQLNQKVGAGMIKAVRGCGGLIGMELESEVDLAELWSKLMKSGLLLVPAANHTLRWLPPLNVTREEIREALDILEKHL